MCSSPSGGPSVAWGAGLLPSSDAKAEGGRGTRAETHGGVDANASKKHLYDVARRLDVPGRSSMSKDELVDAIQQENDRRTRASR